MIKLSQLLLEGIEDELIVHSKPDGVWVSYRPPNTIRGSTASIDNTQQGWWWISRVLVGDEDARRHGIGSIMLRRAVAEVLKQDPKALIVVEPGGYDMKKADQIRFYKKNGFIEYNGEDPQFNETLIYNNQKQ